MLRGLSLQTREAPMIVSGQLVSPEGVRAGQVRFAGATIEAIGPGTKPLSFPAPYKAYMGHSVGDLFFMTLEQLDATLAGYLGCDVSFHCEDPALLDVYQIAPTHETRRPPECEVSATAFALQMI